MDPSIPLHARDITQKMLAEKLPGAWAEWLGVADLDIVGVAPASVVTAAFGHKLLDYVFVTRSGTIIDLEFQTQPEHHLYRFLSYAAALADRHRCSIRTLVVYLGPSRPLPTELALDSLHFTVHNIYVANMDGEAVWRRLIGLSTWTPRDILDLAFFPFMRHALPLKERAIAAAELSRHLPRDEARLAGAALVVLTGSLVDPNVLKYLIGVIRVNNLIEDLERQAIERGWSKGWEQGRMEGQEQGREQGRREVRERASRRPTIRTSGGSGRPTRRIDGRGLAGLSATVVHDYVGP